MGKLKIFETRGKKTIQLIIGQIDDFTENSYKIAGIDRTYKDGVIEAGYDISVSGKVSDYWIDDLQKPSKDLWASLKILSQNPIDQGFEKGIFGHGELESERTFFIEISVEPWIVKDITYELRSNKDRGFRVDGYLLKNKVFLIADFLLFPPEGKFEYYP
jgi:hypothetical protein